MIRKTLKEHVDSATKLIDDGQDFDELTSDILQLCFLEYEDTAERVKVALCRAFLFQCMIEGLHIDAVMSIISMEYHAMNAISVAKGNPCLVTVK